MPTPFFPTASYITQQQYLKYGHMYVHRLLCHCGLYSQLGIDIFLIFLIYVNSNYSVCSRSFKSYSDISKCHVYRICYYVTLVYTLNLSTVFMGCFGCGQMRHILLYVVHLTRTTDFFAFRSNFITRAI